MASSQAILASYGAFQNLTQLLPPSLVNYVDATIGHLSEALAGSNEYLAAQGLSPTVLYSTLACAALAVPLGMSRYGGGWTREGLSPFDSQDSGGVPRVTDDDFSYITSEDLEDSLQPPARIYDTQSRQPPPNAEIDDDILLVKNKNNLYHIHFPAYSIGDGKLTVRDVRDRIALVMELSDRKKRRIKMLYKGRQLKDSGAPIREYGVKNNSEVLVVVHDGKLSDDDSSESSEEIVVADPDGKQSSKSSRNKKKRNKKKTSPRDSSANLDVPQDSAGGSRRTSGDESRNPSRVASPAVPGSPMEKLQSISSHFNTKLLPLCVEFSAHPPSDIKKCEDEHRKLSETIMQQVLLKLDEVETGGDPDIRAKRKELVNQVHNVLKGIDNTKDSRVRR